MNLLDVAPVQRHRLTVEEYHRMGETGVLGPDARVELIEGEVLDMAPTGSKHYSLVARLHRLPSAAVGDGAFVASQSPLHLDRHNEPEPDLALSRPRADFYADALPTARDALLVIEVSDPTLAYDLRTKAALYARHGVPEYWVFDLPARTLRFFRAASGDRYTDITATETPGRIALPGLPVLDADFAGLL